MPWLAKVNLDELHIRGTFLDYVCITSAALDLRASDTLLKPHQSNVSCSLVGIN